MRWFTNIYIHSCFFLFIWFIKSIILIFAWYLSKKCYYFAFRSKIIFDIIYFYEFAFLYVSNRIHEWYSLFHIFYVFHSRQINHINHVRIYLICSFFFIKFFNFIVMKYIFFLLFRHMLFWKSKGLFIFWFFSYLTKK